MGQATATPTFDTGTTRGTSPGPGDVVTPAPWLLTGRGLVLLLAARSRVQGRGLAGRFSAVAFVDYESSDVGPYRELLHVPYVARLGDAVGPMVDHIWVTLRDSAVSGNANWGLSKTVADIERVSRPDGCDHWTASDDDGHLGTVTHRPFGPPLPVGKPRGLGRLVQARGGERFQTPVGVRGLVRPTRVVEASLDGSRVADLSTRRIVAAVSITHGTMTFGVPRITTLRR
jgi:hypothetical protein